MTEQYDYIDLNYMDLICSGDVEMKQTMIQMLLEEIPEDITNMNFFNSSKDWESLGNLSHKLKTTFAYLGHEPTAEANKTIERILRYGEGDKSDIDGLLSTIDQNVEHLLNELRSVLNSIS